MDLRRATPGDAPHAAQLIAETLGESGAALFGLGDTQIMLQALADFFVRKGNRFSHEFTTLAEIDGTPTGLLLAFPGWNILQSSLKLIGAMPSIYGWRAALHILGRAIPGVGLPETERDEFYIAHLCTAAAYRRRGVAKSLLQVAETQAHDAGLKKLSLIVEVADQPAVLLYESQGFKAIRRFNLRYFNHKLRSDLHYRMVKYFV